MPTILPSTNVVETPPGCELDYNPAESVSADQSSNAYAATLVGAGPSATDFGGHPCAEFDGNVAVHYDIPIPSEWTILAVCSADSLANFAHLCGAGPSNAANDERWGVLYLRDTPSSADGGIRVIWGDGTNQSRIDSDDPVFSTSLNVIGVRFTTGTANVDIRESGHKGAFVNVDRTQTQSDASTCNPGDYNFYIGMGGAYTLQRWDGKVARLIVWDRSLDDDEFDYWLRRLIDVYT